MRVARCVRRVSNASTGEQILDLADSDDWNSGLGQLIEERRRKWRQRKVFAIRGP